MHMAPLFSLLEPACPRKPHNLQAETSAAPDLLQEQQSAPARRARRALPLAATAVPGPTASPPFRNDAEETQQQLPPQSLVDNLATARPTANDPNRGYTW